MEYIESYFKGVLLPDERTKFENRVEADKDFAEEVSLYLSALEAMREDLAVEKKNKFKEIYKENNVVRPVRTARRLWPYMSAAAAIVAVVLGWYIFFQPLSPQQLADRFIKKERKEVGVTMRTGNSLQDGKILYIQGNFKEALPIFEKIVQSDSSADEAIKMAGIVSLELQEYDKALYYFKQLENQTGSYYNPGVFYQALTLMKRNLPGDIQQAKALLQQVVERDLDEKENAQELLKKL